jgi:cellulose biosynthesis protein BcsQ
VVIDTKSDFENLTQAALGVSDLTIVVVKDQASLHEARRVYDWLERERRPIEHARILLSLVDLRVKFHDDEDADVLAHLVGEIRKLGYPLFETFLSRSPKVESLYTNPQGRAYSILQAAHQTVVHRQMHQLAQEVLTAVAQNRRGASNDARQAEGPSAHWIEDGPTAP